MDSLDFEKYWEENREKILNSNSEYIKARDSYKSMSGADYLLYAIPVVAGIVFMDYCKFIEQELLKWFAGAVVVIICFVLCVWIKVLSTGSNTPLEIEKKIKLQLRDKLLKERNSKDL